jgi:hypothetical protein
MAFYQTVRRQSALELSAFIALCLAFAMRLAFVGDGD